MYSWQTLPQLCHQSFMPPSIFDLAPDHSQHNLRGKHRLTVKWMYVASKVLRIQWKMLQRFLPGIDESNHVCCGPTYTTWWYMVSEKYWKHFLLYLMPFQFSKLLTDFSEMLQNIKGNFESSSGLPPFGTLLLCNIHKQVKESPEVSKYSFQYLQCESKARLCISIAFFSI